MPKRVVELFTSQGCSSCPSANKIINRISEDPDTLALSYGVTYWDYLGWKDTFAHPSFTDRQKAYSTALNIGNLYTPQIVINGADHKPRYTDDVINKHSFAEVRPQFAIHRKNGHLMAESMSYIPTVQPVLVEYVPGPQSVLVKTGENHGRTLTLTNVVTQVEALPIWPAGEKISQPLSFTPTADKAYALLLHDPEDSHILAAAITTP